MDAFKCIGDDLDPYQVLLERSLQPHDVFELKEVDDPFLDGSTRKNRGYRRRQMAALTMSHEAHTSIWLPDETGPDS
jgi:hypothetical protein